MRIVILLAGIILSNQAAYSQNNINPGEKRVLTGKWQEVKRTTGDIAVPFTDTLQLNFYKRDSVILRDGSGISFDGGALVAGDTLIVAGLSYKIINEHPTRLIIADSLHNRHLVKKKLFHYETLGRTIITEDNLSTPLNIDLKKLVGSWAVYRTQAVPGVAEDSLYIRSFIITKESGGTKGAVTVQQEDKSENLPITISRKNGKLLIRSGSHAWQVYVYKASKDELVFGNHGGIVYFAKPK